MPCKALLDFAGPAAEDHVPHTATADNTVPSRCSTPRLHNSLLQARVLHMSDLQSVPLFTKDDDQKQVEPARPTRSAASLAMWLRPSLHHQTRKNLLCDGKPASNLVPLQPPVALHTAYVVLYSHSSPAGRAGRETPTTLPWKFRLGTMSTVNSGTATAAPWARHGFPAVAWTNHCCSTIHNHGACDTATINGSPRQTEIVQACTRPHLPTAWMRTIETTGLIPSPVSRKADRAELAPEAAANVSILAFSRCSTLPGSTRYAAWPTLAAILLLHVCRQDQPMTQACGTTTG